MQNPIYILDAFIFLKIVEWLLAQSLALKNRAFYMQAENQAKAKEMLHISDDQWRQTLDYTSTKFNFSRVSSFISLVATLAFIFFGGLGALEAEAIRLVPNASPQTKGLVFFGILGALMIVLGLPFELYSTFVIEQKFGFNRQTVKVFILDKIKALILTVIIGGIIVSAILWIMQSLGDLWWLYAWIALTVFGLLTTWAYPTLLAPLFNKFSALPEGELRQQIEELAGRIGFRTNGLFVMDASKRSSHGNAYFTGMFGAKRIVLFDTLVTSLATKEIVAVLAHELGHFKLKHILWSLIRSTAISAVTFFALSKCLPLEPFYKAFGLGGVSNYGALVVFGMWFGLIDFFMNPIACYFSQRNEFEADNFAVKHVGSGKDLAAALLKLREKSHGMPLAHPLFSAFYYSHPPLLNRLDELSRK